MTESRLQHELVMWFGQKYPQYRNYLFMVHNENENFKQLNYRKSMGQIAGVSDLIFINPNNGTVSGIELKAPGSTHKTEHIKRQLAWGKSIIKAGGRYIITSNLEAVKFFITEQIEGRWIKCYEMENICFDFIKNQLKNKTIKF